MHHSRNFCANKKLNSTDPSPCDPVHQRCMLHLQLQFILTSLVQADYPILIIISIILIFFTSWLTSQLESRIRNNHHSCQRWSFDLIHTKDHLLIFVSTSMISLSLSNLDILSNINTTRCSSHISAPTRLICTSCS